MFIQRFLNALDSHIDESPSNFLPEFDDDPDEQTHELEDATEDSSAS